jgi:hypothetical protein
MMENDLFRVSLVIGTSLMQTALLLNSQQWRGHLVFRLRIWVLCLCRPLAPALRVSVINWLIYRRWGTYRVLLHLCPENVDILHFLRLFRWLLLLLDAISRYDTDVLHHTAGWSHPLALLLDAVCAFLHPLDALLERSLPDLMRQRVICSWRQLDVVNVLT